MPLFRLVSTAPPETLAVEFYGADADAAFNVARRSRLAEAELWQGREYLFTLRRHDARGDYRIIRRKPELREEWLVGSDGGNSLA
jgi:hypothetical protein